MRPGGLIRGLKSGLKVKILGLDGQGGGDGRTDGRTDGRLEITPCVLQDIGPLGPLPKKGGYTATLIACGWADAVIEKVTRASGQELYAQKTQNAKKVIVAKALDGRRYPLPLCEYMLMCDGERGSGPEGADD